MPESPLRILTLAGQASDPALHERLHAIEHRGGLERVRLSAHDLSRKRQQLHTDRGTPLALMLDRDAVLQGGSVLLIEAERAIVVELDDPRWLALKPDDKARALELGYFAGNMHWKVRFEGDTLWIALEGPRDDYLARLAHLLDDGVTVLDACAPESEARQAQDAQEARHDAR